MLTHKSGHLRPQPASSEALDRLNDKPGRSLQYDDVDDMTP